MRIKHVIIIFWIPFFLISCAGGNHSPSQNIGSTPQNTPLTPSSVTPTETHSPLPAVLPSASPILPTIQSITATPEDPFYIEGIQQDCLKISPEIPDSVDLPSGELVLQSNTYKTISSYLLDLHTMEKIAIPNMGRKYVTAITTSSSGKWTAYTTVNSPDGPIIDHAILIISPDGKIRQLLDKDSLPQIGQGLIEQWLDDQRLVIGFGKDIIQDNYSLILNPFTGASQKFQSALPGLFTWLTDNYWGNANISRLIFNPDLSEALYPSTSGLVLWDLKLQKPIKQFDNPPTMMVSHPVWSPDGQSFIVDLAKFATSQKTQAYTNLYLVTKTGEIDQLTTFPKAFPGSFADYSWSPDGKLIAFWLMTGEDQQNYPEYQLAIFDLSTRIATNYCLPAYQWRALTPDWSPIWSLDGRWLAIATGGNQEQVDQTVLVDRINHRAYVVADNVVPTGWMKAP
jgi:hypothetical protein